jgi:hypothetical protein
MLKKLCAVSYTVHFYWNWQRQAERFQSHSTEFESRLVNWLYIYYNHRESPLSLSLIRHYRILEWTSSPARVVQSHKFLEIISEVLKRPIDLNLPFVDDKFLLTSHIPTETVTGKETYHMRETQRSGAGCVPEYNHKPGTMYPVCEQISL